MNEITLKAYAKINIGLNLISRRPDGYHNIETIYQQIDLYDLIKIKRTGTSEITIRSNNKNIPENRENICYKALKLLQQATGITEGIEIKIQKNIPISAGLGGGSSDAATVIQGLQQLWQPRLTDTDLQKIALKVGADVPFFLFGGTAIASGIGEKLVPIQLPFNFYCLLIYPNIKISSTWAYKNFNFNLTKRKKCIKLIECFLNRLTISDLKGLICNDLEEVVFQQYPILNDIKKLLYHKGAFLACMSGSGSTIYGLFKNCLDAVVVMKSFPKPYQTTLAKPMITKNHN